MAMMTSTTHTVSGAANRGAGDGASALDPTSLADAAGAVDGRGDAPADVREDEARRAPGRPRSARADEAIIEAVLDLMADGTTVEALSMEAVAARAGVRQA